MFYCSIVQVLLYIEHILPKLYSTFILDFVFNLHLSKLDYLKYFLLDCGLFVVCFFWSLEAVKMLLVN